MAEFTHRLDEGEDGRFVLALAGEIDLSNSRDARGVLLGALDRSQGLDVDLDQMRYMDTSGIASLIEVFQKAGGAGKPFRIIAVSDKIRLILDHLKLTGILLG